MQECKCVSCRPDLGGQPFTPGEGYSQLGYPMPYPGSQEYGVGVELPPVFLRFIDEEGYECLNPVRHDNPDYLAFLAEPPKWRQESKGDRQEFGPTRYWSFSPPAWKLRGDHEAIARLHRAAFDDLAPYPDTPEHKLYYIIESVAFRGVPNAEAVKLLGLGARRYVVTRMVKTMRESRLLPPRQ